MSMLTTHPKELVCLVIPTRAGFYRDLIKHDHGVKPPLCRLRKDITDGLETCGNVTFDLMGRRERGRCEDSGYNGACPGRSKSRCPKDTVGDVCSSCAAKT